MKRLSLVFAIAALASDGGAAEDDPEREYGWDVLDQPIPRRHDPE